MNAEAILNQGPINWATMVIKYMNQVYKRDSPDLDFAMFASLFTNKDRCVMDNLAFIKTRGNDEEIDLVEDDLEDPDQDINVGDVQEELDRIDDQVPPIEPIGKTYTLTSHGLVLRTKSFTTHELGSREQ